jgi:hypothetical protein
MDNSALGDFRCGTDLAPPKIIPLNAFLVAASSSRLATPFGRLRSSKHQAIYCSLFGAIGFPENGVPALAYSSSSASKGATHACSSYSSIGYKTPIQIELKAT